MFRQWPSESSSATARTKKEGVPHDPRHVAFLKQVRERLGREARFDVQVDPDIKGGDQWRKRLFKRLGACNAAVALVNEQAMLHSPWVDFEVKVLAWRAWLESDDFRLVVVPYGGLTRSRIARHPGWDVLLLDEIQMIPRDSDGLNLTNKREVDKALEDVVPALHEVPDERSGQTGYGWIVTSLADALNWATVRSPSWPESWACRSRPTNRP